MRSFIYLTKSFFMGDDKVYARWAGLLLIALSQALVGFNYLFIKWNKRFYESIESYNLEAFLFESSIFAILILAQVIVASYASYHGQKYATRWRLWMTQVSLKYWLQPQARHHIEGIDQRIQEDILRFTNTFEKIFLEGLNALVTVIILVPLLYQLTINFCLVSADLTNLRAIIPSYICELNLFKVLFTAIILHTLVGALISNLFTKPLVKYEYLIQTNEADFRYNLVQARDGVKLTMHDFTANLTSIYHNYSTLFTLKRNFNIWQKSYDQISFLLPFMLIGNHYFSGMISFGILMQCRTTFNKIRRSTSYILDNYTELTELMAISIRLLEFYQAIDLFQVNEVVQINEESQPQLLLNKIIKAVN